MKESSSTQNDINDDQSKQAAKSVTPSSSSTPTIDPNIFCRLIPIVAMNMFNQPQKVFIDVEELSKAINIHQKLLLNSFTQSTLSLFSKESFSNLQNYDKIYTFLSSASNSIAPATITTTPSSIPEQSIAPTRFQGGVTTTIYPSSSSILSTPSSTLPSPLPSTNNAYIKKLENLLSNLTPQTAILSNLPSLSGKSMSLSTLPSRPPSTASSMLPSTPLLFQPSLEPGPSKKMKNIFQCNQCGKGFHARRNLYFHERQVHDLQQTICPDCGRTLRNHAALLRHRRSHYGLHELIHICLECGKRCKERRHLIIHCSNLGHSVPPPPPEAEFNPTEASATPNNINDDEYAEHVNDEMGEEEGLVDGYDDDTTDNGSIQ